MAALTPKQARFVDEYLKDLNGTQAAIRAGYSARTANEQAARLLAKASVIQAVAERMKAREKRAEITQDRVLAELAKIAFGDVRGMFDEAGRLLPIHKLSDEQAAALAAMDLTLVPAGDGEVLEVRKVKRWDKAKALELLGRHLGLWNDKLDLNVTGALADRLARARSRNG